MLLLAGSVAYADPTPASSAAPAVLARDSGGLLTAPDRRVRTTDSRIQSLLVRGARRSRTFAGLITALNRTDVIVYVEPVRDLPATLAGRLMLLPHAGGQRYLRIQVGSLAASNDLIAIIGHELQHALEIAEAHDVRDQRGLVRLYEVIGRPASGAHSYDTAAAQQAGRRVRTELAG
jgi:hypothetical protein